MFFSFGIATPLLLTISFSLCLSILFYPSIIQFNVLPGTAIYHLIKLSSPALVDLSVELNFNKICLVSKNSTIGNECFTNFNQTQLKNYNITLYGNSNVSTNYINLPEVGQDLQASYFIYVRNFYIVIASLVFFNLICSIISQFFMRFNLFLKIFGVLISKFKSTSLASFKHFQIYLLIIINILNIFISVHIALNLKTIMGMINQVSLDILKTSVSNKFLALVWANLALLLTVFISKLVFLQVGKYARKNDIKVDIIQPKV